MKDLSFPSAVVTLLETLRRQLPRMKAAWSHIQATPQAATLRARWSHLQPATRQNTLAAGVLGFVVLLGMQGCSPSGTQHPVDFEIDYTVQGKVEQRTRITPTFCAISQETGRLEIGWKREPHIQFNEVWLGYDVSHDAKERHMFGYHHQDANYLTSTKPQNGEYFLSISLKDFPAAKHGQVRAVTLRFNLTTHAEILDKDINDAAEAEKRLAQLSKMMSGLSSDKEWAELGVKTASSNQREQLVETVFGNEEERGLPNAINSAAWFLSTFPVAAIRDGKKALEYSSFFLKKPEWLNADRLDTLAAAHAECGDFAKAVEYQTQAIEKAGEDQKATFQERLRLYQKKKPCQSWN
jgi:hypothetical protein